MRRICVFDLLSSSAAALSTQHWQVIPDSPCKCLSFRSRLTRRSAILHFHCRHTIFSVMWNSLPWHITSPLSLLWWCLHGGATRQPKHWPASALASLRNSLYGMSTILSSHVILISSSFWGFSGFTTCLLLWNLLWQLLLYVWPSMAGHTVCSWMLIVLSLCASRRLFICFSEKVCMSRPFRGCNSIGFRTQTTPERKWAAVCAASTPKISGSSPLGENSILARYFVCLFAFL